MTKHRRTRRKSQKGGGFWEFLGFGSSEPTTQTVGQPDMLSSAITTVTDTTKNIVAGTEGYLEQAKQKSSNLISGVTSQFSPSTSPSTYTSPSYSSTEQTTAQQTMGGRRRSKSRKMRRSKYMKGGKYMQGGKGGLGLTYYATPVSGLKVVDPTYWIKGGSKRRKTRRKRH